ncbi:MAG TPA: isoprenylcysteine carboxylmethyltransferase family protein [Candidatus Acidoferrum sp.]|nr:isoprenylcysteine carboxylmethyltransferase family protein [Candidatus Acidoferrum sp.]
MTFFDVVQMFAAVFVLWFVVSRPGHWDLQRDVGSTLVLAGIAGIAAARYQLGKSFSLTPQAHRLVTRGVYSKIRNPIYIFGTVAVAGFVLVLHRPILWLLLAAIVIMQTLRARREAQVLEAAFGDAYRDYRRKTWF